MGRTFDNNKDILKKLDDIAAAFNSNSSDDSVDFEHTKNYDYGEDYVAALTKIENAVKSGTHTYTDVTGTLTAGQTSIALQDASIKTSSFIQVFADNGNVNYTSISVETGIVTIGFLAQASDMAVAVRVS